MNRIKRISTTLAITAVGALTGCGGGGSGGDSSSARAPDQIILDNSFASSEDNQSLTLTGSFDNPDEVLLDQTPDIGITNGASARDSIELILPDVDRPITTQLSITIIVGDREVTKELSLLVRNEDGELSERAANAAIEQKNALLALEQDAALYNFFIDYAYLAGVISHTNKESLMGEFNAADAASYADLDITLSNLDSVLEDYRAGQVGQSLLDQAISGVQSSLASHGEYGQQKLADISDYTSILVPAFGGQDAEFDPELGVWSRYTVNDQYGQAEDGEFIASVAYAPIESLIRETVSQSLFCEVL